MLRSDAIQAKLVVNEPGDEYEREADRVAEQVMSMPEPISAASRHWSQIRRNCTGCEEELQRQAKEEEEDEKVQAKSLADQITPLVQRREAEEEKNEPVQAKLEEGRVQRQEDPEEEEKTEEPIPFSLERALFFAICAQHVHENPPCTNRGSEIDKYTKVKGTLPKIEDGKRTEGKCGFAWCASFVKWCLDNAGITNDIGTSAKSVKLWGERKKWYRKISEITPQPGDIFYMRPEQIPKGKYHPCDDPTVSPCVKRSYSPSGHVGFVLYSIGNKVGTIEGNVAVSDRNDGVAQKTRSLGDLDGVVRVSPLYIPPKVRNLQKQPDVKVGEIRSRSLAKLIMPLVQRQEALEEESVQAERNDERMLRQEEPEEEDETVQTKQSGGKAPQVSLGVEAQISSLKGSGQLLPESMRRFFRPRFGYDFSQVRIHTSAIAAEAARNINAHAFTVGKNVVFGGGYYAPESLEGRKLLAHELTHVMQQNLMGRRVQRHGDHSNIVTLIERYQHTLEHAGINRGAWERNLRRDAAFMGIRIKGGIHQELADRLSFSENYLRNKPRYSGLSDAQIGQRIGLYSIDGLQFKKAISGNSISYHAFGLALDVNYQGNPFIGRSETAAQIIQRATDLILGRRINIRALRGNLLLEEVRDLYQEASDALKSYFSFLNDRNALAAHLRRRELPARTTDIDHWMNQIRADYTDPTLRGEFVGRDPAKGFLDLTEDLVLALGRYSGFIPEHELTWGGDPRIYRGGMDLMHFDWRNGTIKNHHRI
jgi:hypothetical protein